MARSKHPVELKLKILDLLNQGRCSISELAKQYGVSSKTIKHWQSKFERDGEEALQESSTWRKYPKELKVAAVKAYLSKDYSLREIIRDYSISDTRVLRNWIKKYTSHSELKDSGKGMSQTMTKGRKTTLEERIQIVKYCLNHQKNYALAAEAYEVSYQQVYQWVKKFEANGEEGLRDHRGRTKEEIELTPEEKMKIDMKRLELENERLRAENLFLKKLEEIERRGR